MIIGAPLNGFREQGFKVALRIVKTDEGITSDTIKEVGQAFGAMKKMGKPGFVELILIETASGEQLALIADEFLLESIEEVGG